MERKWIKKGVCLFCFVMLMAVFTGSKQVWASAEYQEMFHSYHRVCEKMDARCYCMDCWDGKLIKIGKYYFKGVWAEFVDAELDPAVETIYISDKKNSGFQKVPFWWFADGAYPIYTNGKEAYYTLSKGRDSNTNTIYRYDIVLSILTNKTNLLRQWHNKKTHTKMDIQPTFCLYLLCDRCFGKVFLAYLN